MPPINCENGMNKKKMMMGAAIGMLCLVSAVAFAVSTVRNAPARARVEGHLAGVNANDGIDQREAESIATIYFGEYINGCGGPDTPTLSNGVWMAPVREGFAGKLNPWQIRIDAGTGAVSYANGPSFGAYQGFRLSALWGKPFRDLQFELEDFWFNLTYRYQPEH
jgi:hypothetical protein